MSEEDKSRREIRETKAEPLRSSQNRHTSREAEMRWQETHRELLKELAGQWIALEGDKMVAHGPRLKDVLVESRSKGVVDPFVVRIPATLGMAVIL